MPRDAPYRFDSLNGEGTNIFVLDNGFNVDHYDFAARPGGDPVQRWVDNNVALDPTQPRYAEDIYDYSGEMQQLNGVDYCPGHGTQVASIAAGRHSGVASRANLYLVKLAVNVPNQGHPHNGLCNPITASTNWGTLDASLDYVLRTVRSDLPLFQKRSVVNLSFGKLYVYTTFTWMNW